MEVILTAFKYQQTDYNQVPLCGLPQGGRAGERTGRHTGGSLSLLNTEKMRIKKHWRKWRNVFEERSRSRTHFIREANMSSDVKLYIILFFLYLSDEAGEIAGQTGKS